MESNKTEVKKSYGGKALIPVAVFLGLYLGCGIVFTVMGADSPFGKMPRYVAVVAGILVALLCYRRDLKFSEKVDIYCKGAGASGVGLLGIIVLLAGAFASSTAAIGGKEAMVNMGIDLIPTQFLIPGIFLMCCIISTCIGTSMGTQATMIPIAIALAQGAGLSTGMAGAAAIAGAYFGDNLSMISDTTIIACKGVGAGMRDKFMMNSKIALPAGVLAIGCGLSCVLGLALGTASFWDWAMAAGAGMEDMFWLAVFAALCSGLMELVRTYGGIDWLVTTASKYMKSKNSCQYVVSLLTAAISGTTLNNPVACMIASPVAGELGKKYKVSPTKLATLMDIFSCTILMVVPHDSGCLLVQQYSGCTYLDIVKYSVYPVLLTLSTIIAVQFNLFEPKHKTEE